MARACNPIRTISQFSASLPDRVNIQTVTTTGYGESVPVTPLGQALAAGAAFSGIVVLALPIAVFQINFSKIRAATEFCSKAYKAMCLDTPGPVDIVLLQEWIDNQIEKGHLARKDMSSDARAKLSKVKAACYLLSPGALMSHYDREQKGYLSEGQALLLMADLSELQSFSNTLLLNSTIHTLSEMTEKVSKSLSVVERRIFGDEYADAALDKQRSALEGPESANYRPFKFSMRSMSSVLRSMIKRDHWSAPSGSELGQAPRPRNIIQRRFSTVNTAGYIANGGEFDDKGLDSAQHLDTVDRVVSPTRMATSVYDRVFASQHHGISIA